MIFFIGIDFWQMLRFYCAIIDFILEKVGNLGEREESEEKVYNFLQLKRGEAWKEWARIVQGWDIKTQKHNKDNKQHRVLL